MKLFDAEAMGRRITRRRQELGLTQKEASDYRYPFMGILNAVPGSPACRPWR